MTIDCKGLTKISRKKSQLATPGSMSNGEVVNKKAINYTNLWPIALAPVIPAVGIALRYAPEPCSLGVVVVVVSQLKKRTPPVVFAGRTRSTGGR